MIAESPDARPAVLLDDVSHVDLCNLKSPKATDGPLVVLHNVRDFTVERTSGLAGTRIADTKHQEL